MINNKVDKKIVKDKIEWLEQRKHGIGGSDAGAICGLNPYTSAMKIYLDKTTDMIDEYDNEAMRQGRDLEEYVAQRFTNETGKKVRRTNFMYISKEHPFMFANVDRIIVGENAGLECKTASAYSANQWENGNIPAHYIIQCNHYMAVTGADRWYLAVVILGKAFRYVCIERDEKVISDLISIEERFWNENVLQHIPPEPDGSDASEQYLKSLYNKTTPGKELILSGYEQELKRHDELEELINRLEQEKKTIEEKIKISMDDAETAYTDNYVITWRQYDQERFDTKKLKTEHPDVYENYLKKISTRRFTIKVA